MGSEPLGKFYTLLDSSTAYKNANSSHHDPFGHVLNIELLHFYYSVQFSRESLNAIPPPTLGLQPHPISDFRASLSAEDYLR